MTHKLMKVRDVRHKRLVLNTKKAVAVVERRVCVFFCGRARVVAEELLLVCVWFVVRWFIPMSVSWWSVRLVFCFVRFVVRGLVSVLFFVLHVVFSIFAVLVFFLLASFVDLLFVFCRVVCGALLSLRWDWELPIAALAGWPLTTVPKTKASHSPSERPICQIGPRHVRQHAEDVATAVHLLSQHSVMCCGFLQHCVLSVVGAVAERVLAPRSCRSGFCRAPQHKCSQRTHTRNDQTQQRTP